MPAGREVRRCRHGATATLRTPVAKPGDVATAHGDALHSAREAGRLYSYPEFAG